jgi:hypothetical protein
VTRSIAGLPARRCTPVAGDWIVRFEAWSAAPGACEVRPTTAFSIVACSSEAAVAVGPTITPYQAWEPGLDERNATGCAAVPLTSSAPSMISSTRAASVPEAWLSPFATARTMTPGSIVSVAPAGTVTSPWRTYGLPAAVHVVAPGRAPPATIVSADAEATVQRSPPMASEIRRDIDGS